MLLRYAGAKLTAGFDYQSQYPWLDIAAQWEGDPAFVAKRQHISDDLLNLVDAVISAGEPERSLAKRPEIGRGEPVNSLHAYRRVSTPALSFACIRPRETKSSNGLRPILPP